MATASTRQYYTFGPYQLEFEEIGKGVFGIVYKGLNTKDGSIVAAKKINYKDKGNVFNEYLSEMGEKEFKILAKLKNHKNIVQLLDYQNDGRNHWFIMEFCDLGDLPRYMRNKETVSLNDKFKIINECASAISYMHSFEPPIVHRDIKPTNVLVKSENLQDVTKIADFGMGKLYNDSNNLTMTTFGGTPSFMAPEFFAADGNFLEYQPAVDTFSLGLLFNVILTYNEDDNSMAPISELSKKHEKFIHYGLEMWNAVDNTKPIPLLFQDVNEECYEVIELKKIITKMTAYNVEDRMTLKDVQHALTEIYCSILQAEMTKLQNISTAEKPRKNKRGKRGKDTTGKDPEYTSTLEKQLSVVKEELEKTKNDLKYANEEIAHYYDAMLEKNRPEISFIHKKSRTQIHICVDNITTFAVNAVVSAASQELQNFGGLSYAIVQAGGKIIDKECQDYVKQHGKLLVSENCVTTAGKLPCKKVIHAVGPIWSSYKEKSKCKLLLGKAFKNILDRVLQIHFSSVAIPPISAGIFGVPKKVVAEIMASELVTFLNTNSSTSLKHIFVVDIKHDVISLIQEQFQLCEEVTNIKFVKETKK